MTDHLDILKAIKEHEDVPPPALKAMPGWTLSPAMRRWETEGVESDRQGWPILRVLGLGLLVAVLVYQQVRIAQLSERLEKPVLQPRAILSGPPVPVAKVQELERRLERLERQSATR